MKVSNTVPVPLGGDEPLLKLLAATNVNYREEREISTEYSFGFSRRLCRMLFLAALVGLAITVKELFCCAKEHSNNSSNIILHDASFQENQWSHYKVQVQEQEEALDSPYHHDHLDNIRPPQEENTEAPDTDTDTDTDDHITYYEYDDMGEPIISEKEDTDDYITYYKYDDTDEPIISERKHKGNIHDKDGSLEIGSKSEPVISEEEDMDDYITYYEYDDMGEPIISERKHKGNRQNNKDESLEIVYNDADDESMS